MECKKKIEQHTDAQEQLPQQSWRRCKLFFATASFQVPFQNHVSRKGSAPCHHPIRCLPGERRNDAHLPFLQVSGTQSGCVCLTQTC
jgi:hypothetical protein